MSKNRIVAIFIVALIHALLAYAFITGLAYKAIKAVEKDMTMVDVTEEPPPPPEEEPPPPPPDQPEPAAPPVVVPPQRFPVPSPAPPIQTSNVIPDRAPVVYQPLPPSPTPAPPPPPPVPVPPPPPPPPVRVQPAKARADLRSLVSNDDYPSAAQRNEESGSVSFRLDVGTDGRVTNCTVTSSSGSSSLDSTTCRLMKTRAKFTPATDSSGAKVGDAVSSRITWKLEEE